MSVPKEVVVSEYWFNGGDMIHRDELPAEHPETVYNYIKRVFKVNPERYGVYKKEEKIN